MEGALGRAVWGLAWPTVATNLLMSGTGLINVIFVGRLGKDALATVGRSEQIMFLLMSVVMSVSVGTSALVARFTGSDEPKEAGTAARQSLIMGVMGALFSAVVLGALGRGIVWCTNARGLELAQSTQYLHVLALVQLPVFFMIVVGAMFQGLGDTRTPMYTMLAVNGLQVLGDWALIFGLGPVPRLGVVGAAWSWLISRSVGAVIYAIFLWQSPFRKALRGSWRPQWEWFRRVWAIGIPTAIQQTLRMTGSMVFLTILGGLPNGTASVAALTVGLRIESIAFMPGFAYSMAAITMVGQNLGAGQVRRAERAAWACAWQAMVMMAAAGTAFVAFPRFIIHVFTNDPEVVPLGISYLRANGCAEPILSLGIALSGALQGAGETRVPAWVTFVTMWFARVPLTYLFAVWMGLGTPAAWGVMAATNMSYGVLITAYFRGGRWKEREV